MKPACIVKDRTGIYFSVPKEIVRTVNGYDAFNVSSDVVMHHMDDMNRLDAGGQKVNAIICADGEAPEVRRVNSFIIEVGGDALILLEH